MGPSGMGGSKSHGTCDGRRIGVCFDNQLVGAAVPNMVCWARAAGDDGWHHGGRVLQPCQRRGRMLTDRQGDSTAEEAERQAGRKADRQAGRHADRQRGRQRWEEHRVSHTVGPTGLASSSMLKSATTRPKLGREASTGPKRKSLREPALSHFRMARGQNLTVKVAPELLTNSATGRHRAAERAWVLLQVYITQTSTGNRPPPSCARGGSQQPKALVMVALGGHCWNESPLSPVVPLALR